MTPHWGSLYAVDVRSFCLFVRSVLLLSAVSLGLISRDGLMAAEASAGLAQTLRSGTLSDHRTADGIALFVPSGEPATPFLVSGPFTSAWSGELSGPG